MDTVRHLLLEENGTDRIKFDFNFEDTCKTKETFTCRRCGRHEYRNGEFETIKLGDIFTHITRFPSGSLPGDNNLCTQCSDGTEMPENDQCQASASPAPVISHNNNDSRERNNNNNTLDKSMSSANTSSHGGTGQSYLDSMSVGLIRVTKIEREIPEDKDDDHSAAQLMLIGATPLYEPQSHDLSTSQSPVVTSLATFAPGSNGNEAQGGNSLVSTNGPPTSYSISIVSPVLEQSLTSTYIVSQSPNPAQAPVPVAQADPIPSAPSESSNVVFDARSGNKPGAAGTDADKPQVSAGGQDAYDGSSAIKSKECLICNKTFKSFKIARSHFERVHQKEGKFCCHICGISFNYRGSLDSHLAAHKAPEVTHNCTDCGQKFKVKSNLVNHMKVHADNHKKFLCDFCPSAFTKRVNLRCHVKRKHPEMMDNPSAPTVSNSKSESCLSNNTQATSKLSQSNSQSQHPPTESNMSHPYTPLITATKTPASTSNKEKPQGSFKCEHCGRSFLFKNNLKAHLRTHTRDKKYTCEICEKSFIYKESLKNHMLLHSNELPYNCDICGKKFRDRSNRRKHVKNVHKYMFMNGEVNSTGNPTGTFIHPPGSIPPVKSATELSSKGKSNPQDISQQSDQPKKKRNNKSKSNLENSTDLKSGTPGKANNAKKKNSKNINSRNDTTQSVIVSAAGTATLSPLGMDHDRKVIVSPGPKVSGMEYSQLPVTVHVPSTMPSGLHQQQYASGHGREHNVVVKVEHGSQELDMFQRGQNVIVYSKSKDYQNPIATHNDIVSHSQASQSHLSQSQYYAEEYSDPGRQQGPTQTYLNLPVASVSANSPPSETSASNMVFEYVGHQSSAASGNDDQRMQVAISYGASGSDDNVQYSSHAYNSDQGYHGTLHHPEQHQYWSVGPDPSNLTVQITPNASSPSSAPLYTGNTPVTYESPITAASNVLNAPNYAHIEGTDSTTNNFYYKDLSQFDFSYL